MTNADSIYWPLGTYDVHTLKFIAAQNAVDLALYGACWNLLKASIELTLSTSRCAGDALLRSYHSPRVRVGLIDFSVKL